MRGDDDRRIEVLCIVNEIIQSVMAIVASEVVFALLDYRLGYYCFLRRSFFDVAEDLFLGRPVIRMADARHQMN